MFNRIKNFLLIRLGKTNPEELTIKFCLENGMKVGKNCHGLAACTIDVMNCWLIEIGDNVTFAPQVYLLAHDASTKRYLDYTKIAKLKIEDNAFIGARALIMPGVTIGENAIVAAGSVVTKSIPEGCVVGGNPAKILGRTEEYINKQKLKLSTSKKYDSPLMVGRNMNKETVTQVLKEIGNSVGYVK